MRLLCPVFAASIAGSPTAMAAPDSAPPPPVAAPWTPVEASAPPAEKTDSDLGPGPALEGVPEADRAHIRGKVQGFGTALPLPGVSVEAVTPAGVRIFRAVTDGDGAFDLVVPKGRWTIHVLHDAWSPFDAFEAVSAGDDLQVVYRLRPLGADEEVVVTAERAREEVSRQVVTAEQLREVPGSFGDPVRALQSLPGVARPQSLEGNLVVRGAEGINTGFYVDDMPVPFLFHSLLGKSIINPSFVDDVEFFPGGMPSRFGEVTQAAVNVRTGTEDVKGHRGVVDLNFLDIGGALEWRTLPGQGKGKGGGWTFRGAARQSWMSIPIGLAFAIVTVRQGGSWRDAEYFYPSYWDAYFSAEKEVGKGQTWSVSLLAARDTFTFHFDRMDTLEDEMDLPFDPRRWIDSGFGTLRLRRTDEEGVHRADTWVATGPEQQSNLLGGMMFSGDGPYFGRVREWSGTARREDRWIPSATRQVIAGGQVKVARVRVEDWVDVFSDPDVPTTRDTQVSAALFGEVQVRPGSWMVSPGLRGSFYAFNDGTWWQPEPRLTVRRDLGEGWVAKAFVGRFTQVPPADRYAEGIGNPDLPLMTAWQATTGAEKRWGSWSLDSSLYGSTMDDLVVQDLEVRFQQDFDGTVSESLVPVYRPVTGTAYGWEGLLKLEPQGRWWGWAAVTLGRSLRTDPATGEVFSGDYDQPVSITLLAAYDAPRSWKFSGRFRVTSGHPFTPMIGVYDPVRDSYQGWQGDPNSDRFPVFHQLDLRGEKTWHARRTDWSGYLDVYNVYWAKNPFAAAYNHDYTELVPYISVPIIPTLGLEVCF